MKTENKQPLTIAEAGILFGYGYQLLDKNGEVLDIISADKYSFRCAGYLDSYYFDKIGIDYFILARSLSSLTETIVVEGKEIVPLIECAKIISLDHTWKLHSGGKRAINSSFRKFGWDASIQGFQYWEPHDWLAIPNQIKLFNYLYSLHFDNMNLEERGLCKIIK